MGFTIQITTGEFRKTNGIKTFTEIYENHYIFLMNYLLK